MASAASGRLKCYCFLLLLLFVFSVYNEGIIKEILVNLVYIKMCSQLSTERDVKTSEKNCSLSET